MESFAQVLNGLGFRANIHALRVVLPVGISFYTFQTMSYTIDIYRKKISSTRDPIAFFAFVAFFPQLVAGPIERAQNLLPQFEKKRDFDYAAACDGLRQMLWGLFKKMVVADNLAASVDKVFTQYAHLDGLTQMIGTYLFAIQIYCDFSGYSDVAIGAARLLGFNLMRNFAYPYFSRDVAEFWRRWHISLSSWFRDYVFIPLGGNRGGKGRRIRNVFVTFTVSGLWHGANWTFVSWGAINALYYLPIMLRNKQKRNVDIVALGRALPTPKELAAIGFTLILTLLAWVFFRAESVTHAVLFLGHIISHPIGRMDLPLNFTVYQVLRSYYPLSLVLTFAMLAVEWIHRDRHHGLEIDYLPVAIRWGIYYLIFGLILIKGNLNYVPFIYFQF